MFEVKAREGDFVETPEGLLFDVKGLVHPPHRIIAFIRYFPDDEGERKKKGKAYGKVYSFSERYELLKRKHPEYVVHDAVFDETLCEVPEHDVKRHYEPIEELSQLKTREDLDSLESRTLQLVEKLRERAKIPWSAIGISGSILVGLKNDRSDIDPIVYGSDNCRRAHVCLQGLLKDPHSLFKRYSLDELRSLFDFRSKDTSMGFGDFVRTESKKVFQGKFMGTDYFIRFVKDWGEIHEKYGDVRYRNMGFATIKATVADDSEAIFTPCSYAIEDVEVVDGPGASSIEEIASFRGRFCDQARSGDHVVARGKVESVTDLKRSTSHLRLLIGNLPSDHMILG